MAPVVSALGTIGLRFFWLCPLSAVHACPTGVPSRPTPSASGENLRKGTTAYVMVRRSLHSEVAFRRRPVMAIRSVGIDIAKTVFHLVALDEKGSVIVKKKFSRPQLLV
jgi:hypothetical protein